MAGFEIAGRPIGPGCPTYVIAELSANHQQSFDRAVELIRAAKEAGADAVKLQTYTADTITLDCDSPLFMLGKESRFPGRTLHHLYSQAHTPWEWQPQLKEVASELELPLFSTPFDPTAVDFLEAMGVPAHKIASFELVDLPLIEKIAATQKPVILSTGMATLGEIENAVAAIRKTGNEKLILLKCTSAYPASPADMNLHTILHLAAAFHVPVGLSDHTLGIAAPVAAVALGECMIEKHLTLSRAEPGPDSAFSLEPQEFAEMVRAVRVAEQSLGQVHYGITPRERGGRRLRRSLFVVKDIAVGEELTAENIRSIRPADGLAPKYLSQVLGRCARVKLDRGTPLKWEHLA